MGKERKKKAKKNISTAKKKGNSTKLKADASADFDKPENRPERGVSKKQTQADGKSNYSIADLLKQVDECLDNFNFDLAVKFCEKALEIEPDNVEVLEVAGAVYLETGETDKAKTCFETAVKLSPEEGFSKYMNLGQLLEGQEAVAAYNKGIQLMLANQCADQAQAAASNGPCASPSEISTAYCSLAEIYLTDECFKDEAADKCTEYCRKAIECDPNNPEAYQLMTSCLLSQQNMEEARNMLEKSLELWQGKDEELPQAPPPSYETRITTSKLLIELENYEVAGSVLEELIEESDEVAQHAPVVDLLRKTILIPAGWAETNFLINVDFLHGRQSFARVVTSVWYLLGWMYHITNKESSSIRACLEKAEKLFSQLGCDDQPMLDHVSELLASLPEGEVENQEEENGDLEEEELDSTSSGDEEMDTQ